MTEHRFVATERPDARPPAGSKGRANPAEAHQRTPPPAKASSRSSITSPARPQRHNAPAATRTRSNPTKAIYDNASFPRNANAQVQPRHGPHRPLPQHRDPRQSDHLSFPQNDISECQRRAHTPNRIDQPRTIRTINSPFQQNADLSVRSFMHDESWRSSNLSITLTPNLDHTGRPKQRTKPADRTTSERHQCPITRCRRNAVHTSCRENAAPSAKAAARPSTQDAFVATHEGASARSSCLASPPQA